MTFGDCIVWYTWANIWQPTAFIWVQSFVGFFSVWKLFKTFGYNCGEICLVTFIRAWIVDITMYNYVYIALTIDSVTTVLPFLLMSVILLCICIAYIWNTNRRCSVNALCVSQIDWGWYLRMEVIEDGMTQQKVMYNT